MISTRSSRLSRFILLGFLGMVGWGCERPPAATPLALEPQNEGGSAARVIDATPVKDQPMTADRAIGIARADYMTRHPKIDLTTMKVSAEQEPGGDLWAVRFVDDPPRPGGHRTIQIDPSGRVVAFWGGE